MNGLILGHFFVTNWLLLSSCQRKILQKIAPFLNENIEWKLKRLKLLPIIKSLQTKGHYFSKYILFFPCVVIYVVNSLDFGQWSL